MNNQFQKSLSEFETQLLKDAGTIITKLLEIRIQIRVNSRNHAYDMTGEKIMLLLKWFGHKGALRLYFDKQLIYDLFAIEQTKTNGEYQKSVFQKYAHRFSVEFSNQISIHLSKNWMLEKMDVKSSADLKKSFFSLNAMKRYYDIYTGAQFLLNTILAIEYPLLREYRHQWQKMSVKSRSLYPDYFNQPESQISTSSRWNHSVEKELFVSAELGETRIQVNKILDLEPGDVLRLNKIQGDPVDLYVNNKIFAKGRIVQVAEKIGVEVTALIGPEDKIRHLGPITVRPKT